MNGVYIFLSNDDEAQNRRYHDRQLLYSDSETPY